jgi:hypothetical protein
MEFPFARVKKAEFALACWARRDRVPIAAEHARRCQVNS